MLAQLKAQANAEARKALRTAGDYYAKHGTWNPSLDDAYHAAERVVDAIEELERHLAVALQVADDEAPEWREPMTLTEYVASNEPLTPDPGDHFAWPS